MSWNDIDPATRDELKARLTHRQLAVLTLHLAGCGYNRIATMLDIAPSTARTHLRRARQVYDQVTRTEVA